MFVRIKETVAEKLRGLCAGLSPEKRMLTVIVLAADTFPDKRVQEMEEFFN